MIRTSGLCSAVPCARAGRCAVATRCVSEDAKHSVAVRVNQLREEQLSPGTNDIFKIMKFLGPAPELINGRLAMLGFTAAIGAEITRHETIAKQFADAPGSVIAVSILLTAASLIPIIRGHAAMDEGVGEGIRPGAINVTNELINGRAAMLGMAILVLYEWLAGVPLF